MAYKFLGPKIFRDETTQEGKVLIFKSSRTESSALETLA